MILSAIKLEFKRIAELQGATFENLSIDELEEFVQHYDFTQPLIRLEPVDKMRSNKMDSGAIRYEPLFKLYFLTKFTSDNNKEDLKDLLIDQMIELSQGFFRQLDKNEMLYFINPFWKWEVDIIRQYTSNLLCGCIASIALDTACNRIAVQSALDINLNSPVN